MEFPGALARRVQRATAGGFEAAGAYLLLDLVFIALYTFALLSLNRSLPGDPPAHGDVHPIGHGRICLHLVLALMVTDVAENVMQALAGLWARDPNAALAQSWAVSLGALSTVKWLLVLAVFLAFVARIGQSVRGTARSRIPAVLSSFSDSASRRSCHLR